MFKKYTYPNGTRLITIPVKDTKAVTIFILYGVGSRYESLKINGISHFIEHLMFKGTKKRPTTLEISKELDSVGAEFNAMTSKDYTGYYIKISNEKVDLAVDVLSDMLLNSKFDEKEINRERGVIVEEINMYHDNPLIFIESLFEEAMYEGNSLGWEISGPAEVIRNVKRQDIVNYRDHYYTPANCVVAVAGKIDAKLKKMIEDKFIKKMSANHKERNKFADYVDNQSSPRIKIMPKKTKQVQLSLGFPAFGYPDKRKYALHLLSVVLGGNMSSRLFISVRERKGLAYFIRCYPNFYSDTGNLFIQAGLDAKSLPEAIKIILHELSKIKKEGINIKELKNARDYLKGKINLSFEETSTLADFYAKQELLADEILTPEQKIKEYEKVTPKDIKKLANDLFKEEKINFALIGEDLDEKKILKMVKI